VELEKGQNALTATLAPPTSAVTSLPTTTVSLGAVTLASSVNLGAGGVAFYRIPLDCAAGGEYQIIYDTGKARWAWMGAYDDSWLPLQVVCSDQAQGWVVVSVPAGVATTVNIALSNSVSSPGYPAGSMTGALQARHAVFMVPGGTGSGTSADPSGAPRVSEDGQSGFARAGDVFTASGSTNFDLTGDMRVYGGFSADWKSRSGRTAMGSTSTAVMTVDIVAGSGCLDRLSISGPPLSDTAYESTGLMISAVGSLVVSNCTLSGNSSGLSISGESDTISTGVYVELGNPEIASCVIAGGIVNISNYVIAYSRGVYLNSPDEPSMPYIHNCTIDGGQALSTNDIASTAGIYVAGQSSPVVAACLVWGGSAETSAETSAESCGIRLAGEIPGAIVSSCVVSGGRVNGYYATSYGVWTDEAETTILVGCTIDSGIADSSFNLYAYSVAIDNNGFITGANSGVSCGNILLSSSTYDDGISECFIAPLLEAAEYSFERFTGNLILSVDQEMYYNPDGIYPGTIAGDSAATVKTNNSIDLAAVPASRFRSYPAAPTTYAEFLAVDWRPTAASSSGESPETWGGTPDLFTDYPAVGLDLAGNVRTYSGTWNRGAYQ